MPSPKKLRTCKGCGEQKLFGAQNTAYCSLACYHAYACSTRPKNDGGLEAKAKALLLKQKMTLVQLANRLDCAPSRAQEALDRLKAEGYNVELEADTITIIRTLPEGTKLVVKSKDFFDGKTFKFGAIGDTHLGSTQARQDVLACLYDIFEREGVRHVYHTGNIVDGYHKIINHHELLPGMQGMEAQAEYLAKNYPKRDGITTHFITGECHEGWWVNREGIDIGRFLESAARDLGRSDLHYIGHLEADIELRARTGNAWMRVSHPGGGTAYAISYNTQKKVESYQGGEKPHIELVGHFHKFEQGYPREVHIVQIGCVQDQTAWMRKRRIQAHVGGTIIRFHQADTGEINRFSVEWLPFYDRGFYQGRGKYRKW